MAKFGNFVGQGWAPITRPEAKAIMRHLASQLEEHVGADMFSRFGYKIYNEDMVKHLIVSAWLKNPFSGRNQFRARIYRASMVCFFITKKKKGWLEIKDPEHPYDIDYVKKDYDNCPDYSWGCSMSMVGEEKPYRRRTTVGIQNWSPYVYGTEVEDLTYTPEDLRNVLKTISPL